MSIVSRARSVSIAMVVYYALLALVGAISAPQLLWPWIAGPEASPDVPSPQEESA